MSVQVLEIKSQVELTKVLIHNVTSFLAAVLLDLQKKVRKVKHHNVFSLFTKF